MKLDKMTNEELIGLYWSTNDEYVKERFFEKNLKMVHGEVNKFRPNKQQRDEMVSEGYLGMLKAFNTFDVDKGCKFNTYGTLCIKNEILMYLRRQKTINKYTYYSLNQQVENNEDSFTYEEITASDCVDSDTYTMVQDKLRTFYAMADPRERKIYYLTKVKDLTQEEISKEIGLSRPSVARYLKKIKNKLQ